MAFEKLWNCSSTGRISKCSVDRPIGKTLQHFGSQYISRLMDSVLVLATAAARVLNSTECVKTANDTTARDCIKSPQLLEQLLAMDERGYSGHLKLDDERNLLDIIDITQFLDGDFNEYTKAAASYDMKVCKGRCKEEFTVKSVSWKYHILNDGLKAPESTCNSRCKLGERQFWRNRCCVSCVACSPDERLYENNCKKCPREEWPDKSTNFTTCVGLTFTNPSLGKPVNIVFLTLCIIGLLVSIAVGAFFVYNRETFEIKASSRELSVIKLVAIALGYTTAVTFLVTASRLACLINFIMFTVSFNLIYGPLLVKTVRIYRIFALSVSAGGRRKLKLIGSIYQIIFCVILFLIQVNVYLFVGDRVFFRERQTG